MSRRDRQERPERPRQKTDIRLLREAQRDAALERRERFLDRRDALIARQRAGRLAELQDAREAREALHAIARREDVHLEHEETEGSSLWSGLAMGVGVAALVGMAGVVVYLLVRKRDGQVVGMTGPQGLGYVPMPMPILIGGGGGGVSQELSHSLGALARAFEQPQGQWTSTTMKTFRLPSLNDRTRGAVRVAQATDVPFELMLRTIGPAGMYAAISLSQNEINQYSGGDPVNNPPMGDVILLPVSQFQLMKLRPKEILYAKGSNAAVSLSVSSNQVAGGARLLL